jgi:hypothetical protein
LSRRRACYTLDGGDHEEERMLGDVIDTDVDIDFLPRM